MNIESEVNSLIDHLENLEGVMQPTEYHPERDTLQHSLQVFFVALEKTKDKDLIAAALLHDIGKSVTSNKHSKIGADILSKYSVVSEKIIWLVENHFRVALYLEGKMKNQAKIVKLINNEFYPSLVKLREFDLAGRNPDVKIIFDRELIKKTLLEIFS